MKTWDSAHLNFWTTANNKNTLFTHLEDEIYCAICKKPTSFCPVESSSFDFFRFLFLHPHALILCTLWWFGKKPDKFISLGTCMHDKLLLESKHNQFKKKSVCLRIGWYVWQTPWNLKWRKCKQEWKKHRQIERDREGNWESWRKERKWSEE